MPEATRRDILALAGGLGFLLGVPRRLMANPRDPAASRRLLYSLMGDRLVFLCWKRGEKSIEFYHHLEDGFQGRQPIPSEELAR